MARFLLYNGKTINQTTMTEEKEEYTPKSESEYQNMKEQEQFDETKDSAESMTKSSEVNSENSEYSENSDKSENSEEKDPLEQAQEEIEALKDKYLRSVAEFDNYRKRTLKERAELILNGGEKVISAVLPVIDDMERAIENGAKTDDPEVLREGMTLIHQKFVKILEGQGVSLIETADADFDTDIHEAVAMVPGMGDDKKGKVIDCLQKGYKLNDKVIRHAKVAVGQ